VRSRIERLAGSLRMFLGSFGRACRGGFSFVMDDWNRSSGGQTPSIDGICKPGPQGEHVVFGEFELCWCVCAGESRNLRAGCRCVGYVEGDVLHSEKLMIPQIDPFVVQRNSALSMIPLNLKCNSIDGMS
jgi:hypothetical protein